jgi:hypothetical protein
MRPDPGTGAERYRWNGKIVSEQKREQIRADRFRLQSFLGTTDCREYHVYGEDLAENGCGAPHQPTLYRSILTGELIESGPDHHAHNPMVTNTKMVYKALKSVDLASFWTIGEPPRRAADYICLVASWLERPDFMGDYGGEQHCPSVPGEYDHKND